MFLDKINNIMYTQMQDRPRCYNIEKVKLSKQNIKQLIKSNYNNNQSQKAKRQKLAKQNITISTVLFQPIEQKYKNMNISQILSDPNLSIPQLFLMPDILSQIKYNMNKFIDYCLVKDEHNQQFTKIMITLGIKTPMYKHLNVDMKKVAYVATEILTGDHDSIADLFINDKNQYKGSQSQTSKNKKNGKNFQNSKIKCYNQDSQQQVIQQIVPNETTGQLTTAIPKKLTQQQKFNQKYLYLIDLLSYLMQKNIDQNCLNYLCKILNTLIRVKWQQFFKFLITRNQYLQRMIKLTNYPSMSYFIVKMLNEGQSEQDSSTQNHSNGAVCEGGKYRKWKLNIVQRVIQEIIADLGNTQQFGVRAQWIQEVFDKNRHRGDQMDQIKIVTQPLVNRTTINKILSKLFSKQSKQIVSNCLVYLNLLIYRMNIDQQRDHYSYNQSQNYPPTMQFQTQQLFNAQTYAKLVDLCLTVTRPVYNAKQVLAFYQFLLAMTKNTRWKSKQMEGISQNKIKQRLIMELLTVYKNGQNKNNGIIKNKIVLLIQTIYRKQYEKQKKQQQSQKQPEHKNQNQSNITNNNNDSTMAESTSQFEQKKQQQQQTNCKKIKQLLQSLSSTNLQQIAFKDKLYLVLFAYLDGTHQDCNKTSQNNKIEQCEQQNQTILTNLNKLQSKYGSVLAPTNYTQNRSLKIKQLEFVKVFATSSRKINTKTSSIKNNTTDVTNAQKNGTVPIQENNNKKDDGYDISKYLNDDGAQENEQMIQHVIPLDDDNQIKQKDKQKDSQKQKQNGTSINLSLLNNKINAIKSKKKGQKSQQQPSNTNENGQGQTNQNKKTDKTNQNTKIQNSQQQIQKTTNLPDNKTQEHKDKKQKQNNNKAINSDTKSQTQNSSEKQKTKVEKGEKSEKQDNKHNSKQKQQKSHKTQKLEKVENNIHYYVKYLYLF